MIRLTKELPVTSKLVSALLTPFHLILYVNMFSGYTEYLATGFDGSNTNVGEIAIGFYSSMWAYDGWYVIIRV